MKKNKIKLNKIYIINFNKFMFVAFISLIKEKNYNINSNIFVSE